MLLSLASKYLSSLNSDRYDGSNFKLQISSQKNITLYDTPQLISKKYIGITNKTFIEKVISMGSETLFIINPYKSCGDKIYIRQIK